MTDNFGASAGTAVSRKPVTLERTYRADIQDVWDLPCVWAGAMLRIRRLHAV